MKYAARSCDIYDRVPRYDRQVHASMLYGGVVLMLSL